MAGFLLFGQRFPVVFLFRRAVAPKITDDFGDFRVGEVRMGSDDGGLIMLAVENEGWIIDAKD